MPASVTARLASPRTTSAEPPAAGETTRTRVIVRNWATMACHWSIEVTRCSGGCTIATHAYPPAVACAERARDCFAGSSWM